MTDLAELRRRFAAFGDECNKRAPLYGRLAAGIAGDDDLLGLMLAAPPEQHNPTLLLCAVHDLVLRDAAPALAAYYPNLSSVPATGDPFPVFRAVAMEQADVLRSMLAVRHTQTNEIGRCALFLPALGLVAAEMSGRRDGRMGGALSLVDVGTSAGLNQLLGMYGYDYDPGGSLGPDADIRLECGTRGAVPLPGSVPRIARSTGIDTQPIDVGDDDAVRWLEACVWPDQADRFERLRAAVRLARRHPPDVRVADAVEGLGDAVAKVIDAGHPVVLNSWVLSYLSTERQHEYVAALERIGSTADLSWVLAESPAQTPGLPIPTTPEPEHRTALSLVTWRDGRRTVRRLATCHPHGIWLHWED